MSAEDFDTTIAPDRGTTEPAMIVDVEGFEGPLDLLLMLARQQKVDLAKISILALADQYLTFIEAARQLRLELAADYLVMAAWLAYLKSRLLLPEAPPGEGPSAEDMALALAYRLRRLEAFRERSSCPRRITVIAKARAARGDRLGQHATQLGVQTRRFSRRQRRCRPRGIYPGSPERFVRVDVAHSNESTLVHQHPLDCLSRSPKNGR